MDKLKKLIITVIAMLVASGGGLLVSFRAAGQTSQIQPDTKENEKN